MEVAVFRMGVSFVEFVVKLQYLPVIKCAMREIPL